MVGLGGPGRGHKAWKTSSEVGNRSMQNLNGNVLCVVDTETTGLIPGYHDIIEVAVVPLGADLKPMQDVPPFVALLRPKRPQNLDPDALKVNHIKLTDLEVNGIDPWRAADMFDDWFERLKLAPGKKIAPLGQNWPFDRSFIIDWLGPKTFESIFWHRYRDTMTVALFLNDRSEFQICDAPFPQPSLQYIATKLGVPTDRAHRALEDALVTAEVYRRMMTMFVK